MIEVWYFRLKDKPSKMTVSSRNEVISYLETAKSKKWPESGSPWDVNSRATSSSWPEDIEEAATKKVLKLWATVERTLYKEDDEVKLGTVMDECVQWRSQIPHYRVVGKNIERKDEDEEEEEVESLEVAEKVEELSPEEEHLIQIKSEQILDRLLEYIMIELEKEIDEDNIANENNNDDSKSVDKKPLENLDQVLRITPAPTYSGRRLNVSKSSKIVSPVPFAVTTRESFCTLKTTPIKYAGHLLELSTPQGFNRNMNSASKLNYSYRKSPTRLPQRHSAWQSSVSPAWPKNLRLAPIDPSRLPSSKNRSIESPTIKQRGRRSLSPILRPVKPSSCHLTGDDFLEVTGKQITQSAKLTRLNRDSPSLRSYKKSAKNICRIER
ncbi:hypothetical protein G9C98_002079 [Cotesia typhae]|uniref:Uncharacterized protein n=1 Tax=Cotesia typhae TaxID=2053667 RepID=A0A8J5RGX5_9HYME|nr:hypothetical protein G9C98_002079 [Cotesia typhae]